MKLKEMLNISQVFDLTYEKQSQKTPNSLTWMFFDDDSHITNQSISPTDQQRNVKIPEEFS